MKRNLSTVFWLSVWVKKYFWSLITLIVIGSVLSLLRVALAVLSKALIDGAVEGVWQQAVKACLSFVLVIVAQIILKGISTMLSVNTLENMSNQMRNKLFHRLSHMRWLDYTAYHTGDLMTRITSDVNIAAGGLVRAVPEVIALTTGVLAAVITLLIYDPVMAAYALLLGPAAMLAGYIFGSRFIVIHEKAQEAESNYRSYIQESLEHILIQKTFCREEAMEQNLSRLQETKKKLVLKKSLASQITSTLVTGGFWICYLLVFGWGAYKLYKGLISFGTLTVFIQLVAQVQSPFMELAGTLPQAMSTFSSARRLLKLEGEESEKQYLKEVKLDFSSIHLEGIHFSYKYEAPVLQELFFQIQKGEVIGLIGASGEGKTTLIHILMQLIEPQKGKMFIQYRQEVWQTEASLRNLIAYVPQGNTLFSGSIAENLRIGDPDATKAEMLMVLKTADAMDFISKLEKGIDTIIGERGIGLSEGQAQRIAIARALIKKAPILVLDEATSALDTETEERVLRAISNQYKGITCIIITHRLTLLQFCDRILELNKGRLYEKSEISSTYVSEALGG
ncbi:multidrug ABC transporter ATP-binding protein [Anaerocolumna cellulosilytica]|uniref:Multidrug ABC transporter ATP-binding protein n=1 Tax=Anaerocolumna cellulosilytica TaxID=433286 RepID=A0A6S6RCR6_9FIRM|nr:ABC transporter ATP-binding protein [Anaerocolumna cellulosilytica]MBB5195137.1 ABC-type multidrug transport system fused ATPase/permease subunit [Anaerocolumna cellulosilytica]BCJ96608.1 multidrug ABC transporter ATP-binding protein [Anaerocolumna cellulosilytica]